MQNRKTIISTVPLLIAFTTAALLVTGSASAAIITTETGTANAGVFTFSTIPSNSSADYADATNGKSFVLLDGQQSGDHLSKLNNGLAQSNHDDPNNSEYAKDNNTIRVQVDLGDTLSITQINSYSWHTGARTPQHYKVYGASAPSNSAPTYSAAGFENDSALSSLGYTLIATVDTAGGGSPRGVSINDVSGSLGNYRYILFDIATVNGTSSGYGTFYGEIDVYATAIPEPATLALLGLGGLVMIQRRRHA